MTTQLLDCVEVEPQAEATAAIIWLHGLGADGHDFPPIVPELGLPEGHGIRFVFPHAAQIPVTVNGGMVMPAWYDILGMDFERRVDEEGVRASAERIELLMDRERGRGIPSERILLAGFSQGGAIALHVGLRSPETLAGIVALSTYIACDANLDEERSPANHGIPIFQAHGSMDPMVPMALGQAARERLEGLEYCVEWHEYPMQHQVCLEEIQALGAWLRERLA
ncbi:carboxylesterase [Candidatus Woesearchaeota archaeon]|jgi:phospholipase/carboxylesterase|nr:carboxylesterase [Candidatus Woesearchaeota archaeon]MDP6741018.1 carboxylesterase [Planctomycetota bacterium]MDP6937840.1 carboxylesterase [Planctomycetota bacterium]